MMAEQKWTTIVEGNSKGEFSVKELWNCKDLIFLWVRRDFVSRYKQTILGPAWAILQPLFTTVVYSIFFGEVAKLGAAGVPNFIFYLSGNIVWGLFAGCLGSNANTFINNKGIFSKVYFPRLVMPISSAFSQFINFFIQYVFMLCFLIFYIITNQGVAPNLFILMTPVIILQLAVLGTSCGIIASSLTTKYRDLQMVVGFGVIISAATTKYRDLRMLVSFGVQLWMYGSPVAYDMFSMNAFAPGSKYYGLYMLNPVTPVINIFRYAYLGIGQIDWLFYAISWIVTILVAILAVRVFSKVEKTFIDTI